MQKRLEKFCSTLERHTLSRLILIRHGESEWNLQNRFTGWADVDLTIEGAHQIRDSAATLLAAGIEFDIAYSSVLRRCVRSLWCLLEGMKCPWVPQRLDWRLNERHYGGLTGLLKAEAQRNFGVSAVTRWRRDYCARPPALDAASKMLIPIDRRYVQLQSSDMPVGESLCDVVVRVGAAWETSISSALRANSTVLIMGHGNSLRALTKIIDGVADDDSAIIEIGNAVPIVYELNSDLRPLNKRVLPGPPQRVSEIL